MWPGGLSFPLADHMNCLLSGGIRSHLWASGLTESLASFSVSGLDARLTCSYGKRKENTVSKWSLNGRSLHVSGFSFATKDNRV